MEMHESIKSLGRGNAFLQPFLDTDPSTLGLIGGKAANLVNMSKKGIPVPEGFCMTTETYDYYVDNGELPEGLIEAVTAAKEALGGKVAIRSSANCEDGSDLSMAGVFETHYVYEDDDIGPAIEKIYQQCTSEDVTKTVELHEMSAQEIKMGLVVQRLIDPDFSGVIYTGINNGDNALVQYVDGFGNSLVDGESDGSVFIIDGNGFIKESSGFEISPIAEPVINQITELSSAVQNLYEGTPQDIEFLCKDGEVSIVQTRTLTTPIEHIELEQTPQDCLEAAKKTLSQLVEEEKTDFGTETAIFSDANYSEILPRPTEMDIGLHMYVWGGSDGVPGSKQLGHSEMGYKVGEEATGMIRYIGGRTYFSLARCAALYHIGFPETKQEYFDTLLSEYLETVNQDPDQGAYPQMGLFLQDPTFEDLQGRYGERASEYLGVYERFSEKMQIYANEFQDDFYAERLPEMVGFFNKTSDVDIQSLSKEELVGHLDEILEHVRTVSYVNFVRGARLGFYYSQKLQSMLVGNLGVTKEQAEEMFSDLSRGSDGSAITDANIAISEASSEEDAIEIAKHLIGHISTGEMLEIRHPLMRDDPEKLTEYVRGLRRSGTYKSDFDKQKEIRIQTEEEILARLPKQSRDEMRSVMDASQTYMALRETAKYEFTKEYLLLRDGLEELSRKIGLDEGDIYFVYPREISALAANPRSMQHLINSRKQSFDNHAQLDMPPVIREQDIENLSLSGDDDGNFMEAKGKFLAGGELVEGTIVNIDDFDNLDQVNKAVQEHQKSKEPVILVAKQMNLTHDPLIAIASGLVIENAGIVAHGAQRARELGKGAIGKVKSSSLKTGLRVQFDPGNRSIKKIIENQEL